MLGGLPLASWIILAPIGLLTLRILVDRKIRRFSLIHGLLLAFVAWVAASLAWTVDAESTVTRLGTFVQLLILVGLIWELAPTKNRVQGLIVSYVIGSALASSEILYNYAIGRTTAQEMGAQWETYRYSVDGINADESGLIIALSIPMALYLVAANRNRLLKALCWLQLVIGFTAILITATRGALFAAIVGVLLMAGSTISRMSRMQRAIAALVCIALVPCAIYLVPKTSIERILSTGTEITEGTLTHRTVIWAAGMEVFRDHPVLGVGAGAYGRATVEIVDIPFIAHNTFISVLVELGVIGELLLLLLLACMLRAALRMPYLEKCLWLAVLAAWVTGASSVTWEHRKVTWLLFGLLAAQAYARRAQVFRWWHASRAPAWKLRPLPASYQATTERLV